MRVVVLGGAGNFGSRIVRALKGEPGIELVAASRRATPVAGAPEVPTVRLDLDAADFEARLRELSPALVLHTAGPFQGQDYRVARIALACGAHYLDLADGRAFVCGFTQALDEVARQAGRVAISGASTLPALSSAVVDALVKSLAVAECIEIAIAPGQRAPRGAATLRAVFSYLGRPIRLWEHGRWTHRTGWMDLRRVRLAFGSRLAALCDVPDLELLPRRHPTVHTVRFHAALEFAAQHALLWAMAALVRAGAPLPVARWSAGLDRMAALFDPLAGKWGGMRVSVVGQRAGGGRCRRTWLLTAPALQGPEIPCMAAINLVRRLARGPGIGCGARDCTGLFTLEDFQSQFDTWGIRCEIREEAT